MAPYQKQSQVTEPDEKKCTGTLSYQLCVQRAFEGNGTDVDLWLLRK